jgi:hypothetical protein
MKSVEKQRPEGPKQRGEAKRLRREKRAGTQGRGAKGTERVDSNMRRMIAYVGYISAAMLIMQSMNAVSVEPVVGFRWSTAVVGLVLGLAVALIRNEMGLADKLDALDARRPGRFAYTLAWGLIGVVAMAGVMTLPRY